MSVNGGEENGRSDLTALLTTFWVFDTTTLSPASGSRSTAFRFTDITPTEITIQSEHTHVTVNNVETSVNLSGLLTKIEVTESTNIIVALPGATAALKIPGETSEFTITAFTITISDIASSQDTGSSYCFSLKINAGASYSGDTSCACVPAFTTTITPSPAVPGTQLYLCALGLQMASTLPGITNDIAQSNPH